MSSFNRNNKALNSSAFLTYAKKYWWIPILGYVCIWAYFQIKKLIDTQKTSFQNVKLENDVKENSSQNDTLDPKIINKKKLEAKKLYPHISADKMEALSTSAIIIARKLGTHVTQNATGWFGTIIVKLNAITEDEKAVIKELKKHPGTFTILEQLYYKLHTHSRSLKSDILEYFSESDLKIIRAHYKKYGKTWL